MLDTGGVMAPANAGDAEVRSVSKEEIKAGVTAQAGHPVTFVVGGLKGKPVPALALLPDLR